MRIVILLAALATMFSPPVSAQTPPGAEAAAARLMQRVGPRTRSWIRQEAAREHAAGIVSEAAARQAIAGNPSLGHLAGGDVEALAFLVLMEASKSAQQDLKEVMDRVKRINDAKAALRGRAVQRRPGTSPARIAIQARSLSKPEFDRRLHSARNDPDSLSELGETESLRLQMAMDRMSKLMSTLSNILQKLSATNASITRNLK
jgi:hypothetical protein